VYNLDRQEDKAWIPVNVRADGSVKHHTVSNTAMMAICIRAGHQSLDADPKIQVDPISVAFERQLDNSSRNSFLSAEALQLARSVMVVRSRYAEDVLEEVRAPFVILGAGFETFAYRQPAFAKDLAIYEVDHPATQAAKRELLERAGIAVPANLRWCPIDFETTRLREALVAAGFDFDRPAVISWLGVMQYLTRPAIRATLEFVQSLAKGTALVFSFLLPEHELSGTDHELMTTFAAAAAARGEPVLSCFQVNELLDWLSEFGFHSFELFGPQQAGERYFQGRTDGLRPPVLEQLVRVTV
jgi:methyltransferase (TIGR00027 family)